MQNAIETQTVAIGQRVRIDGLMHLAGIVFQIHNEQAAEPGACVTRFDTVTRQQVTIGTARYDVVLEDGSIHRAMSDRSLRSRPWALLSEVASAEEVAAALAKSATVAAQRKAAEDDARQRFAAQVDSFRASPEFAHLAQGDDCYSGKLAAANIRKELRRSWPKVKFSVRKTDHGSIRVTWIDGPTADMVEAVACRFKAGSFDSMQDMYNYEASPFNTVFGGAKYVFCNRDESAELVTKAIDKLYSTRLAYLADAERPCADDFQRGRLWHVFVDGQHDDLQRLIRDQLNDLAQ